MKKVQNKSMMEERDISPFAKSKLFLTLKKKLKKAKQSFQFLSSSLLISHFFLSVKEHKADLQLPLPFFFSSLCVMRDLAKHSGEPICELES